MASSDVAPHSNNGAYTAADTNAGVGTDPNHGVDAGTDPNRGSGTNDGRSLYTYTIPASGHNR